MSEPSTPNFAEILGPAIESVSEEGRPALLAMLERGAAARYRHWASEDLANAPQLEACAAREEQIADRVDRLFRLNAEQEKEVEAAIPIASSAYLALFEGLPLKEQWRLQAIAERTGAAAWRGFASQHSQADVSDALEACACLEEENASTLEALVSS